jgi:hypothetical protein
MSAEFIRLTYSNLALDDEHCQQLSLNLEETLRSLTPLPFSTPWV